MTIVKTIDEVDAAWLTGALGAEVSEFAVTPVGTGQMGDSYRLAVTYGHGAPGAPASVVVKLASTDERSRATGLALRAYEVEVNFYLHLARTVDIAVPGCFFAEVDPGTGWFTLVLEDLAPAVQGDHFSGCTPDQAELALAELARLQGPRWGDPELANTRWLNRRTPESDDFTAAMVASLWPGFLERYGDRLDENQRKVCASLMDRLGEYLAQEVGPSSIVHGDYRLDNMLLGATDGPRPVAVVDWQTAAWGPPLMDAAYFLSAAFSDRAERAAVERDLIASYHDHLRSYGVDDLSWDECWTAYRRGTFSSIFMAVASSMLVERTDRGDDMFMTSIERGCAQIEDLDALELLP